jgi:hypothetical protein
MDISFRFRTDKEQKKIESFFLNEFGISFKARIERFAYDLRDKALESIRRRETLERELKRERQQRINANKKEERL